MIHADGSDGPAGPSSGEGVNVCTGVAAAAAGTLACAVALVDTSLGLDRLKLPSVSPSLMYVLHFYMRTSPVRGRCPTFATLHHPPVRRGRHAPPEHQNVHPFRARGTLCKTFCFRDVGFDIKQSTLV